jgi:electron transfer flavoprotein alpha subunit
MSHEMQKPAVWVLAEQSDGKLCSVSLQLIGHARKLASGLDGSVEAVLIGDDLNESVEILFAAGADKVYVADSQEIETYQSDIYTRIIVELAQQFAPEILLIGSTFMGRELAPLIAASLETGLTAHCIDLELDEDKNLAQHIPAYGGIMTIICPEKRPQMATVAKGVFPDPPLGENRTGEVEKIQIPEGVPLRVETLEVNLEEREGVPLESAPIVVAGGAGAGDIDGWNEIADLAEVLNAALGSTRPAVDEGWTDLETMIGQSGKMVSPEIYIGVGLSGELQHMVGIVGAKIMVAINNDPKSPVFEQVDYGIVEDCREFIPVLIKKIREYQGELV